jgi:cytochrome c oxidase subunit 1
VVAHFHYTFFPIAVIAVFAGITYWFPKMFGRLMNEKWGKIHFWGTIAGFNGVFIPLFFLGAAGEHRRIFDYTTIPELGRPELQALRIFATVSLLVLLAFQPIFLVNFVRGIFRGPRAEKNPWRANTLEWSADSPPPHGNWAEPPRVYRGPYEYSVPGRERDYWPQDEPA